MAGFASFIKPLIVMRFGKESGDDILEQLTSLSFESDDSKAAVLTLKITDRDRAFIDDPRLENNKHITFRIGYANRMCRERTVIIKEVHPVYPDTGNVSLTIKAFDLSAVAKDNAEPKNWGKKTASEIASAIAQRYGYDEEVEATNDIPTKDRIQSGAITDMEYLRSLAARLNYDCFVEGAALNFKPREYKGNPAHVFVYFSSGESVLRKFQPSVKSYQPDQHAMSGASDKDKKNVAGKSADSGEKKSGVSVLSVNGSSKLTSGQSREIPSDTAAPKTPTATVTKASRILPTPETTNAKVNEVLKGSLSKKESKAVDATADLLGSPDVYLREIVRIEGVGRKHSGNYRVRRVLHEIDEAHFFTTIGLMKNALGASNGAGSKNSKVGKKDQADQGKGGSATETRKVKVVNGEGITIRTETRSTNTSY